MLSALPCGPLRGLCRPPAAIRGALALALALAALAGIVCGPGAGVGQAQDSLQLMRYEKRMKSWFRRIDRNGDGRITPAEARGHLFLEMNFERLDAAGRGYLRPLDLAPARTHYLGERLRKMFQKADQNRNGQLSLREADAFPWLSKRFTEADRDRNGSVTLEEFWQLRRSLAPPR